MKYEIIKKLKIRLKGKLRIGLCALTLGQSSDGANIVQRLIFCYPGARHGHVS
jgi:hypothetical protein